MLGAIFSVVGNAISSAVSSIGSALSSFSTSVGGVLGGIIDGLKPVATAIGNFANSFLQALGILKPNESTQDLGDRALQAADKGITLDKFENFDDYMAELRDFDLDPEVSAKHSTAEKLVAGMGIATIGVEDKFNAERGSLNGLWLLPIANPTYFTPERMQSLVQTGKLGGDILAYLESRLSGAEASRFEKSLESGTPQAKLDDLYESLDSAKNNWAETLKNAEAAKGNPAQ